MNKIRQNLNLHQNRYLYAFILATLSFSVIAYFTGLIIIPLIIALGLFGVLVLLFRHSKNYESNDTYFTDLTKINLFENKAVILKKIEKTRNDLQKIGNKCLLNDKIFIEPIGANIRALENMYVYLNNQRMDMQEKPDSEMRLNTYIENLSLLLNVYYPKFFDLFEKNLGYDDTQNNDELILKLLGDLVTSVGKIQNDLVERELEQDKIKLKITSESLNKELNLGLKNLEHGLDTIKSGGNNNEKK